MEGWQCRKKRFMPSRKFGVDLNSRILALECPQLASGQILRAVEGSAPCSSLPVVVQPLCGCSQWQGTHSQVKQLSKSTENMPSSWTLGMTKRRPVTGHPAWSLSPVPSPDKTSQDRKEAHKSLSKPLDGLDLGLASVGSFPSFLRNS